MEISGVLDFLAANLLATYGAAVGTIALGLNFVRYRHAVAGSKIRLKLEILPTVTEDEFIEKLKLPEEEQVFRSAPTSLVTHKVKVRNIGAVTAHLEDVWVVTKQGRENATTRRPSSTSLIYEAVSTTGNIEIPPRSSRSFSVFSKEEDGYLTPVRAFAIDETGKKWRS
ncbi:hypothetical protein [uncultured Roseobacter sp.]|uniref:hypothetical protein n=1 Tax=uncultured Roseobacter sp. TaxID=114847 RepID=UPI002635B0C7|nr:hypothetical protein [uncultured Roseobacter sp.]